MDCTVDVQFAFILPSIVIFFGGLFILLISRIIWRSLKIRSTKITGIILKTILSKGNPQKTFSSLHLQGAFHHTIEMLLSAETLVGRVLMILVFLLSIGSLIIYFINSTDPVASCTAYDDITISFDMIINGFFAIYFGLRFLAADDKIKFWLQINTIVDIFTIPTPFISCYLKRNWLGLRFLRALRLLELPQILQILGSIKTRNSMKFSKLLTITLSCCLTAAGFIHLVENFGDPWLKVRNSQTISYFECIYLIIATITTVGYGDFVANTLLGRTFIILFILGSLVTFANYIPEMVEILAQKRKYNRSYKACKGKKFIVVCGNITVESVGAFLGNFLRLKSGKLNTEVVFLGEVVPSLELEALFRCYLAYTTFIYGSALKMKDLKRVSMEAAEACLIIANPSSGDSHEEDTTNIMRVLSIKNYFPKTRIIIQILRPHNKSFLSKIPSWDWNSGDNIICFAELKLGFIAQGCLVPGLCTFLTSLFIKQSTKVCLKNPWQHDFYKSLSNTILTQRLSDDFAGMSFYEVCRLCFVKMNIMLIAIEYKSMFYGPRRLLLNPPAQIKLRKNTLGFFIAESAREVKRAYLYCVYCHGNVSDPDLIEKCNCKARSRRIIVEAFGSHLPNTSQAGRGKGKVAPLVSTNNKEEEEFSVSRQESERESKPQESTSVIRNFQTQEKSMLDSSGMFHWCKATPLENVILRKTDKLKHGFQNHVVVCIFGDAQSRLMGLQNFVMPLRASNYTEQELKDIVFIGSLDYLKKEWQFLEHFPKLFILPGSALYTKDLFAVNIDKCSMCVILPSTSESSRSATLVDSENILATLNIKSFKFFPTSPTTMERFSPQLGRKGKFRRVPALTELKNPSNIHFIEQLSGMEGLFPGTNLHLSTAFATGTVFSGNFLDSLLASAFYNYHVLEFLEMLVRGGISSHMQSHFDNNKQKSQDLMHNSTLVTGRTRCKLGLLPLEENVLSRIEPKTSFEQLFCGSLDKFGIICLGLYRLMDEEDPKDEPKRFVITRPPKDFKLLMSDLVFCAIPYGLKTPDGKSMACVPAVAHKALQLARGKGSTIKICDLAGGQCPGLDKEESPHDFASPESESEDGIHRDSKKSAKLCDNPSASIMENWTDLFPYSEDLPKIIFILPMICIIAELLKEHLKDFANLLPVVLFVIGCIFQIFAFTSDKVQSYAEVIHWINQKPFFHLFMPVMIFNVTFHMHVYKLQKIFWQIFLITAPGFLINYLLIFWYVSSMHKFLLHTTSWALFSIMLVTGDPMQTEASIRNLGLPKSLVNLINGESLITTIMSFFIFFSIININTSQQKMDIYIGYEILQYIFSHYITSSLFGYLASKLVQNQWIDHLFFCEGDVNYTPFLFGIFYLVFYTGELLGMSGICAVAIMGLFVSSTKFNSETRSLLVKFLNLMLRVAYHFVFVFLGLLIPAHTYLYIMLSDLYISLTTYFTLLVLRLIICLSMGHLLSRMINGYNWRWSIIMASTKLKGLPNITMALMFAYSEHFDFATEEQKSQILFYGVLICIINLLLGRFILMAVIRRGLPSVTDTENRSRYHVFQHFQELTKSAVADLKLDTDLVELNWDIVEREAILQNPCVIKQEETTGEKEIEAMELAKRRLLSARIASYQRQYRSGILSHDAMQMLIHTAESFVDKEEYNVIETIKTHSFRHRLFAFITDSLSNWEYDTRNKKGVHSRFPLQLYHKIVFTDEFQYCGYLLVLVNAFVIIIFWTSYSSNVYGNEILYCHCYFLFFYTLEALLKIGAMRKEYFSYALNIFELSVTIIGIVALILIETIPTIDLVRLLTITNIVQFLRILRILKPIRPCLLQIIDKKMNEQQSLWYAALKGYIQGESDIMTNLGQIAGSIQVKKLLLRIITRNDAHAMKELGYFEFYHPEITIPMKTMEQINAMINLSLDIVNNFETKGMVNKSESSGMKKLIMAKKKEVTKLQPNIKPLTNREVLNNLPWLENDESQINFMMVGCQRIQYFRGGCIFEEGAEPQGIYVIISGMIKLQRSEPGLVIDQIPWESEEKDNELFYKDYLICGAVLGELCCLTNEPMKYSASCKTVVEVLFIPKYHLYLSFKLFPIEYQMWLKIGRSITASKIQERLSYEDWNYKLQLKLRNISVKDIPMDAKTQIYDKTAEFVILIYGSVEDCRLRKVYKSPFIIPKTCFKVQGLEKVTKVMIVQTSRDSQKSRRESN